MRLKMLAAMLALALAVAEGAAAEVVPMGKDTFMATLQGYGLTSVGHLKARAYQEAAKTCSAEKREVQVVSTKDTPATTWTRPEVEVNFRCLTADDPELQRPTLRQTPDVVIQDERTPHP